MTLIHNARQLRKSLTPAERHLWRHLRQRVLGVKFRRQKPIGPFIPDFVCPERMLIIELDGSQHMDNPEDMKRDVWLEARGYRVLRFWNNDVLHRLEETLTVIEHVLAGRPARFQPPSADATSP